MKTIFPPQSVPLLKTLVLSGALGGAVLLVQSCSKSQQTKVLAQTKNSKTLVPLTASGSWKALAVKVPVAGAADAADFADEVYGESFEVSAQSLPEGTYTIEIDESETFQKSAGLRSMKITAENVVLADNYDIFKEAGGFAKAVTIRGKVQHADDTINGPLTIKFETIKNNAKFNAIRIFDDKGDLVAGVRAGALEKGGAGKGAKVPVVTAPAIYNDAAKPMGARVDDLIRRMSLDEKAGQLVNSAPAIPRLGLPAYDYWNEALHGVARNGNATVFPQAIGMAATWDEGLIHNVADAISTEARAKYEEARRKNDYSRYTGLTFWSPNINIFRDPRWGRGQETYGEDPYLTTRLGVNFIEGMQGNDPKYYKTIAGAKHFAVHSGPEASRLGFNVNPDARDLYETYLPQFKAAVQEAKVGIMMASYNAIDGMPNSMNKWLLTDLLRDKWGFKGHVTSDCSAIRSLVSQHKAVATTVEGSAKAIKAGLDIECGPNFKTDLPKAVAQGLLTEADIDKALHRVLLARFQLGMFDPPAMVPFTGVPMSEVESPKHLELARQTVRESLVLLKNQNVLPLDKTKIKKIAVIGVNAPDEMNGNYNGKPSKPITILDGIKDAAGPNVQVEWKRGAPLADAPAPTDGKKLDSFLGVKTGELEDAVALAKSSDIVIYVGGLNAILEGEQSRLDIPGFSHGDRTSIELPAVQTQLLKALRATGKPVVFVNCSGSAVAMPWEAANIPAIVQAWYPGGEAGAGVADVLFGATNPSGRLPVTFYEKTGDLPDFNDYHMKNRTYRYFTGKPLFAFGHGLSYTTFDYGAPKASSQTLNASQTLDLQVPIKNSGARAGDEVVQVYWRAVNSPVAEPIRSLAAFQRVSVARGATATASFQIPVAQFRYWDVKKGDYAVAPGDYVVEVGAASDDIRQSVKVKIGG